MQQLVNHWEGFLRATGGAVPTTCFWYLIDIQMKNDRWQYVTKKQHPVEITIKDDLQHCISILHLEAHEAQWMLRVQLVPEWKLGNRSNYLLLVSMADWKVHIAASRLNHKDTTFSLKNLVLQKLSYPLMATTFT